MPSPPGKFSQRTDKTEPKIVEPDLDRPDMQYGDRQQLIAAQRIARRGAAKAGAPAGPGAGGQQRRGGGGGGMPPWLMGMDSQRPQEPVTAGLDMGAGPGHEALTAMQPPDDIRVLALEYIRDEFGNTEAAEMLNQLLTPAAPTGPLGPVGMQTPPPGAFLGGLAEQWVEPEPTEQGWRGGMDELAEGIESGEIETEENPPPRAPTP